jgi:hypothetical protein
LLRASADRAPAVLRRRERRRFSSASDDEVAGFMRAMREQHHKSTVRIRDLTIGH